MARKQNSKKRTRSAKNIGKDRVNTKFEGKSIAREEDARSDVRTQKENDPAWYGVSQQLINDAARLSFNNPAGLDLHLFDNEFDSLNSAAIRSVPGIIVFDYYFGPGESFDFTSAINLAAKNIYAFVRHVNSGASNYESADLMLYLYSVITCYVWYSYITRLYAFTLQYRQSNRYYNYAILRAMGFNPLDIESQLPRLRFIINRFVRKVGTFPIPANLNITKRQMWLASQVIEDETNRKAQLYMFNPAGLYTYEETDEDNPVGYLKWHNMFDQGDDWIPGNIDVTSGLTVDAIEVICNQLCDKLQASEDIGVMSGDIIKAYGSNILQLGEIDENYKYEAYHNEEVLSQIHNMTIVGEMENLNITQNTDIYGKGELYWTPTCTYVNSTSTVQELSRSCMYMGNRILDMKMDNPEPSDIMVATRFMSIPNPGGNPRGGTEYIKRAIVWYYDSGNLYSAAITHSYECALGTNVDVSIERAVAKMTAFDWHPLTYLASVGGAINPQHLILNEYRLFGEIDNYTVIGQTELSKMHEAAVLSLWDVPETAFYKAT